MFDRTLPLLAVLAVCAMYSTSSATADEPIATPSPKRPDIVFRVMGHAESRIHEALQSQTSLEFIETPLQDARSFLAELHNVPIQIDSRALRAADISSDGPITFLGKGMQLTSALNLMLQAEGLTYMVKDEALVITTPAVVAQTYTAKVYDITALLPEDSDAEEPVTADSIAETISGVIAPATWSEAGGNGSVKAITLNGRSLLAINQTYDTHQQIYALLGDLQDAAK